MQAMVIVEGAKGRGSAFLVRMGGEVYLVTNSHVICGNQGLQFKTLGNQQLTLGSFEIADSADLVRARVSGPVKALDFVPKVEEHLKIGDPICVAGNSEGGGVVREITGKVLGLGPERLEVDAPFVAGNSGSPILLKSTGQVVGVATYLLIPPSVTNRPPATGKASSQPATSLNEVRRFGYRLDSVAKWIAPVSPDGIMKQGAQLKQIKGLTASIVAMMQSGPARYQPGRDDFADQNADADPSRAAFTKEIDDLAREFRAARRPVERAKILREFFDLLKSAAASDIQGLKAEAFSGYFAVVFREELERRHVLTEWLAELSSRAAQGGRLRRALVGEAKLVLADQIDPHSPPTKRHRVTYPPEINLAQTGNIFWIIKDPENKFHEVPVDNTAALLLETPVNGWYRVSVERWSPRPKKKVDKHVISNFVEINVSDLPAPPPGAR